ncbi:hypothetical protein GCM10010842_29650 [Deinococcus daejeonensis]|uniref:Uncharacterized protein n=2 Tax=Deinococcus daejeonensis TaxID=1007098 RepID=A0ABQ2JAT6_9DEIO|nr:hypothetical protein GCM10010842_29650 [Deinococcus daejeonensis]
MAPLKNAIQAVDPTPDRNSALTLALSLLSELCEQKVAVFTEQIESDLRAAGSNENKSVPVTNILARHAEYRAYVQQDNGKMIDEVTSAVRKFLGGGATEIVNGIGSLVTTGLDSIIGAGTGMQREFQTYYVVVQNYSVIRFDVRAWAREIEAQGITENIETCLVIVGYQSSVDVRKLDFNAFIGLYQLQLAKLGIPDSDWQTYFTDAEAIYQKLGGSMGSRSTLKEAAASTTALMPGGTEDVQLPEMLPGTLYGLFEGATAPAPRDFLPRDAEAERLLPGVSHD